MKFLMIAFFITGNVYARGYTCQGQCVGVSESQQSIAVLDYAISTSANVNPARLLQHLSRKCQIMNQSGYERTILVDRLQIAQDHTRSGESVTRDQSTTRRNDSHENDSGVGEDSLHASQERRGRRGRLRRSRAQSQDHSWWYTNDRTANEVETEDETEQIDIRRYDNQLHYNYIPVSVSNNCRRDNSANNRGLEYLGQLPDMF